MRRQHRQLGFFGIGVFDALRKTAAQREAGTPPTGKTARQEPGYRARR
ncbi:hypothetical protein [Streptomyces sp. NPDC012888]